MIFVSGHCIAFISKICQTVAEISQFPEKLLPHFWWVLPFGTTVEPPHSLLQLLSSSSYRVGTRCQISSSNSVELWFNRVIQCKMIFQKIQTFSWSPKQSKKWSPKKVPIKSPKIRSQKKVSKKGPKKSPKKGHKQKVTKKRSQKKVTKKVHKKGHKKHKKG